MIVESQFVVISNNHFHVICSTLFFDVITRIKVGSSFEPQERMRKKVRTMFDPSTSMSINFLYALMYLLGVKRQYVTDHFT